MSDDVRHPTTIASIAGEDLAVQNCTLSLSVGEFSTGNVTLHETTKAGGTGGQAIDALALDHTQRIGVAQAKMFETRTEADSTITISDGNKHQLVFKGFLSNPNYGAGPGGVGSIRNITHESIRLNSYRASIYSFDARARDGTGAGTEGTMPFMDFTSADMGTRFMEVLDYQIKYWTQFGGSINDPAFSREVKAAWHALNQDIYPDLKRVMNTSTGLKWPPFALSEMSKADHDLVSAFVRDLITQQGGNFFGNFGLFEQGFQCQFVPNFVAGAALGSFISWSDVTRSNTKLLQLPIKSFSISGGEKQFMPITHVFIGGALANRYRDNVGFGQGNTPAPTLYAFPETAYTGGQVLHNSGPPWMSPVYPDPSKLNMQPNVGLDISKYQAGRAAVNKYIGEVVDKVKLPILKLWAQNLYAYTALSSSNATAEIPLDLTILPGTRYLVETEKGQPLFTGFLRQVRHSVRNGSGNQGGSAGTSLSFSHVESGSFVLPGF